MGTNGNGERADPRRGHDEPPVPERRYRTVIEQSPLSIHVFSPDGTSLLANSSWDELWNLEEGEEPEGHNIFGDEQLRATGLVPYIEEGVAGQAVTPPPLLYDPARTGRGGEPRWLQAFVYPVKDDAGSVREVTLIIEDVTERKRLEERLSYLAFRDPLTGLPNRASFAGRLGEALGRAGQGRRGSVAVLYLDLDNFKNVNDSFGHAAGDRLLVEAAGRLGRHLPAGAFAARFGGDEFGVLLAGFSGAAGVAGSIVRAFRTPFALDGREVFATASVGVVLGGPGEAGGASAEELLRDADAAMYRAKGAGKDRHEAFDPSARGRLLERLGLEADLRRTLERGEMALRYQPMLDLETGRPVGAEALLRWEHPERGPVSPADFVPLAEETGLIVPIGRWVLREACRRAGGWRRETPRGAAPPFVSVNLSPRQFREPGLAEDVAGILSETGLDPEGLVLEITEGALMDDAPTTVEALGGLRRLGVGLAVDDFGTGYSSLSYLERLPVDHLKIDRSFVAGLDAEAGGGAIVSATVALARALGLRTVAEGVETEGQLARLRELGCDLAQGFHLGEPAPAEDVRALLLAGGPAGAGDVGDAPPA